MEMAVESVVYGNQLFVGQVQSIEDTLTFKLGNCNDFLAFGEYAVSVGSVKMNLYRSRKKLLKVLKKEGKHL